jgi:hypothetical protein
MRKQTHRECALHYAAAQALVDGPVRWFREHR